MRAPLLRKPGAMLGLVGAIIAFGVFSSSVGIGALPVSTLPVFGVTNGDGSRMTVAELGDINGDHVNDYAIGMPSAGVGGAADSGIVYVFLGHTGTFPPDPATVDLASASFRIVGPIHVALNGLVGSTAGEITVRNQGVPSAKWGMPIGSFGGRMEMLLP